MRRNVRRLNREVNRGIPPSGDHESTRQTSDQTACGSNQHNSHHQYSEQQRRIPTIPVLREKNRRAASLAELQRYVGAAKEAVVEVSSAQETNVGAGGRSSHSMASILSLDAGSIVAQIAEGHSAFREKLREKLVDMPLIDSHHQTKTSQVSSERTPKQQASRKRKDYMMSPKPVDHQVMKSSVHHSRKRNLNIKIDDLDDQKDAKDADSKKKHEKVKKKTQRRSSTNTSYVMAIYICPNP